MNNIPKFINLEVILPLFSALVSSKLQECFYFVCLHFKMYASYRNIGKINACRHITNYLDSREKQSKALKDMQSDL